MPSQRDAFPSHETLKRGRVWLELFLWTATRVPSRPLWEALKSGRYVTRLFFVACQRYAFPPPRNVGKREVCDQTPTIPWWSAETNRVLAKCTCWNNILFFSKNNGFRLQLLLKTVSPITNIYRNIVRKMKIKPFFVILTLKIKFTGMFTTIFVISELKYVGKYFSTLHPKVLYTYIKHFQQ